LLLPGLARCNWVVDRILVSNCLKSQHNTGPTAGGQRNAATQHTPASRRLCGPIRTDEVEKEYTQICGQALLRASSRRLVACTSHVDEWHFLALWSLVSGRQTPYSYIFSYHALATNSLPILLSPCLTNPLRLNNRNNAFLLPSIRGYARLEDR
jgi:hypothetical protein